MSNTPGIGPTQTGEHATPMPTDRERIEALEQEVQRMREQLRQQGVMLAALGQTRGNAT